MRGRRNLCAGATATALSFLFTASVPSAGFADEEPSPATPGNPARTADRSFELDLGGLRFDPLTDFPALPSDGHHLRETGPNFRLIQFDGPTRPEWLRGVRDQGIEVVQYIHPFTYVVWGDAARLDAVRGAAGVRWAGELAVEFRVLPHQRGRDGGVVPTMLLVSRHADETSVRDELAAAGARVHTVTSVTSHTSVVFVEVAGNRYLDLGRIPAVYAVQYIPPETGPRGEMSNQSIVGKFGPPPGHQLFPGYVDWLLDTGYDGGGVTVGIVDGGIRATHQDLADRIAPCVPSGDTPTSCTTNNNVHGTHVAGAVAGTGATGITDPAGFLRGQGVAPGANVVQQRYQPFRGGGPGSMIPDGMLKIYRESALSGALLTNNSWGPTTTPQGYDIPTQQVDMITRDADPNTVGHQPVLPVWSIMNGNGDSGGACAPSSLGSPDEAKNLFAVGSTRMQIGVGSQFPNIFDVSPNSGHGPACDGRIVPHVVAPGCNTDSTTSSSDNAHTLACGTSMASPVVSGAVSIFIERYRDLHGADPSPALIKAAFTAVATNLEGFRNANNGIMGHPPDRFQGWGRLDLDAVANPARNVMFFDQEVVFTEGGQDWSIELIAEDPSQPVRLMLIWTDAPGHGLGGTTPAWVNDLDLLVEAGADTYLGNVIGSDGFSTTGGAADERNNMEGVFLRPDQHGGNAFSVTVFAANVSGDALNPHDPENPSQDFALACYNCESPSRGVLQITPGSLDFGEVLVGETGDAMSLTLANSGTKSVTVSELSGPAAPFGQAGGGCETVPFVLEPTTSCTLDFSFSPTSEGLAEGEVTILSDAPSSPDKVDLHGIGIGVAKPELTFDASSLDFGDVPVGETSPSQSSTLHNTGDVEATVLVFSEPGGGFDADTTTCGVTLPAGESCPVMVTFTPSEAGPAVAVLEVDSDEGAAASLGLAGHGLAEGAGFTAIALEVDPDGLTSDGNRVLEPGELVVVAPAWRNDGTSTRSLEGTAADFTGPDGADYLPLLTAAQYGDVGPGETASCLDGGACYQLGVTDPAVRPATHWEATFEETLSDETAKTWIVHIGESFLDVPKTSPFYRSVETLLHAQVTGGCSDTEYCPTAGNTRAQMPVFVIRALAGGDFVPPACVEGAEMFLDVPATSGFCPWIQELADRGVVAGCGGGNYCPNDPVNRQQMAVFLLRTLEGEGYTPPACSGTFDDVPCPSPFADWVEELYRREVTGGCSVDPLEYCPNVPVNRQQMAVFVSAAFGLTLYGP